MILRDAIRLSNDSLFHVQEFQKACVHRLVSEETNIRCEERVFRFRSKTVL